MKLVDEWKQCWKWLSVHFIMILGILPTVWFTLPAELKAAVPAATLPVIAAIVAIGGVVGRITHQGTPPDGNQQ